MSRELRLRPVVRLLVTIGLDPTIDRTYTVDQAPSIAVLKEGPEQWMKNPRQRWDHPQDPVTFSFQVREADREQALEWIKRFEGELAGRPFISADWRGVAATMAEPTSEAVEGGLDDAIGQRDEAIALLRRAILYVDCGFGEDDYETWKAIAEFLDTFPPDDAA